MLSWASLGFLKTKLLLVVCLGLFLSLSHWFCQKYLFKIYLPRLCNSMMFS
jgi:hypothetical protein